MQFLPHPNSLGFDFRKLLFVWTSTLATLGCLELRCSCSSDLPAFVPQLMYFYWRVIAGLLLGLLSVLLGLGFLVVGFESKKISTGDSWSSRVQGGRKIPMALLLTLPASDSYKHGLFLYSAAIEGRFGTGKVAVSAGQVLPVTSRRTLLCLSPYMTSHGLLCLILFLFPLVSVHFI